MNKKVLTLCAGFLLAGSAFTTVDAETLADAAKVENGYFTVYVNNSKSIKDDANIGGSGILLGDGAAKQASDEEKKDLANIWKVQTVTSNGTTLGYKLINAKSNAALSVKVGDITYDTFEGNDEALWFNVASQLGYFGKADKASAAASTNDANSVWRYNLQQINPEDVNADDLNELYNSIGFNMIVNSVKEEKQATIKNLFATSGRVLALEVSADVKSPNNATDGAAYPDGTYFVTSTPTGKTWAEICKITDATEKNNAQYAFLEACTFIAVNSVENDINSKADREAGAGFQLTTVLGRDLQKYQGTVAAKQPTGRDIAVANACFSVKKDVNDKYAIGLETFWFNKAKAADIQDNDAQISKPGYWLNVTEKVGEDNDDKYLTTEGATAKYIFSMKDLATTSVYSWLKNEKKMSVYNIQFVSDNDDINGKYLFVPAYGNKAYAKGVKFTDINMPETQFIVTDVDADNNTVTFTNRANRAMNEAVKIYAEADGTYTIALENKNGEFAPLNVLNNGDIKAQADVKLHGLRVKITPVESVDYYYGAWNVDNGEEVTLLFARDNTPTSNKLYVKHPGYNGSNLDISETLKVTNEVAGTLQFALKKSNKPVVKTYGYTYYLGETDKEQEKWEANGDTIAYYTYQLEAYYEGEPCGYYLHLNDGKYKLSTDADNFIIKDNEDGSVQLIKSYDATNAVVVDGWKQVEQTISYFENKEIKDALLTQEMAANYVKTYLNLESPEVSLDPKSTYVTFKAEEGDYITMKDDRDAVLVSDQPLTFRVFATDTEREVPNFLVSTGWNDNTKERMFLFNPKDSVNYLVAEGDYDKAYQWSEGINKAIFKSARMAESCDTLYTTIKGNATAVATVADQNKNVQGGLNYFKYQIIEDPENEGYYMIRQNGYFLTSTNGRMGFTKKQGARSLAVRVEVDNVESPTANESINAANNVVVAGVNGAIVVKGAEGKNVIVSTILGKVVANEVVSSDNAQIAAPAGIVVVSVDGESFKVVVK
ncbi:DUF6383 domain-containing protein [Parabacteroides sp. AD58]|uniref:DUF6383 domain-containing protein n=1 Tax=Parabacteroides absconsus TaxID=2951805 RepID=A0ABZ2IHL1_9BACT|nr:DUF6383 domain-containing protein [Parabacteroides sp. AD58]MCM6903041.1 DUF6383 domain-containing protein [Parabacteroides sp. AD58]